MNTDMNTDMSEEEVFDYLFEGVLPEIRVKLVANNPRTLEEFTAKAKLIERGLAKPPSEENSDGVIEDLVAALRIWC